MVQTAINVTLNQNPSLPPSKLLAGINTTITRNIRQLNEDKYMTITVLAAHANGEFIFSGLHQDIMVYRAESSSVEHIETEGMWIGMMDDIQPMLKDKKVSLAVGDAALLFTDGITEAWKKNTVQDNRSVKGDMFGDERLVEIFREHGAGSPEEIKNAIIAGLSGYDCSDDITLVIFKRITG
jgi:serine phosphatase RsbU (regulator of sigma subunit)